MSNSTTSDNDITPVILVLDDDEEEDMDQDQMQLDNLSGHGTGSNDEDGPASLDDHGSSLLAVDSAQIEERNTINQLFKGDRLLVDIVQSARDAQDRQGRELDDEEMRGVSQDPKEPVEPAEKQGWIVGVFLPCTQNILGVILFLRMAWIVGQAGIIEASAIVLVCASTTFITSLSLAAISTNGKVGAGGAFSLLTKSLGPSIAGVAGTLLMAANSCGSAMYILGAVETIVSLIPGLDTNTGIDRTLLNSLIGLVLLVLLTSIVLLGVGIVSKMANPALVGVFVTIICIMIGLFIGNARPDAYPGVEAVGSQFVANLGAAYQAGVSFQSLIALFYPSVTGILAGSNRSGDLKKPSFAIPVGTVGAIGFTTFIYLLHVWMFGMVVDRSLLLSKDPSIIVAAVVSWPAAIVVQIGILLSSLGAGLQTLVSAPKLLQAIVYADVLPGTHALKGEHSRLKCVGVVVLISAGCIMAGNLDAITPIITNFFLITYMFINLACAALAFVDDPSWRPAFRYFSKWLSAFGTIAITFLMFYIEYLWALASLFVAGLLYMLIRKQHVQQQWGDALTAMKVDAAWTSVARLPKEIHVRNWRPQIMCFVDLNNQGTPCNPLLLSFVIALKESRGFNLFVNLQRGKPGDPEQMAGAKEMEHRMDALIEAMGIPGFTRSVVCENPVHATLTIIQSAGMGSLVPNTVLTEFPPMDSSDLGSQQFVTAMQTARANGKTFLAAHIDSEFLMPERDEGFIDLWWIVMDGGLLMLLGWLMSKSQRFSKSKLRLFLIADVEDNSIAIERDVKAALTDLRIHAEVTVIELEVSDSEFAYSRTMERLERTRRLKSLGLEDTTDLDLLRDQEYTPRKRKDSTNVQSHVTSMVTATRCNELMRKESANSSVVFVNIPSPPENKRQHSLFLTYLESLIEGLRTVVMVRGSGVELFDKFGE